MSNGSPLERSFSRLSILASAGRARPSFWKPTAGGTSAPATDYSSWLNGVPQANAAGTLTGSPGAFQPASTGAISSHRLQPCWRGANHRPAGGVRMGRIRWTDWPDDLREIVYIDHYGNATSG